MHIPDNYLGPQTYITAYAVMVPIWVKAARAVSRTVKTRQTPMLAFGAAFSFIIMMFNVPAPGGTSGHAVGAVLAAILLGPWAACIAVTIALVVQALLFGDGGVTAVGANCFNMAFAMPMVGYAVFRLMTRGPSVSVKRQVIAAAVAGYVGLNVAALLTGFEFGIQPMLARDAAGLPIYAPYSLATALTVMGVTHLAIFGFVEAAVTAGVLAYILRTDPSLVQALPSAAAVEGTS